MVVLYDTNFMVYDTSVQKHRDAECQILKGIWSLNAKKLTSSSLGKTGL